MKKPLIARPTRTPKSIPQRRRLRALWALCAVLCVTAGLLLNALSAATAPPIISAGAVVRHAPEIKGKGRVEGSIRQILSGESTELVGEDISLAGGATITGDLFVPGTPTLVINGQPTFGGVITGSGNAQPSGYTIKLSGNVQLGHLVTRTDPIALVGVAQPPSPTGTRDVVLTTTSQSVGDFSTLRNLTLGGSVAEVTVTPGTYGSFTSDGPHAFVLGLAGTTQPSLYNLQELSLSGGSSLRLIGPVRLNVARSVTLKNGSQMGNAADPLSLMLSVAGVAGLSNQVTVDSSGQLYGIVRAPSGTVSLNGNSRLVGTVFCDRLSINGSSVLQGVGDAAPPLLNVTQPADGLSTNASQIEVMGTVSDQSETTVAVNGQLVPLSGNSFASTVALGEGSTTIKVTATDLFGNQTEITRTVTHNSASPVLSLTEPTEGQITRRVVVLGSATGASALTVTANGTPIPTGTGGAFSGELDLPEGAQQVHVIATDAAGNHAEVTRTVTVDKTAPVISGLNPAENSVVDSPVTIGGRITDASAVAVVVNGQTASVGADGLFTASNVPIVEGENEILVMATDAAGNDRDAILTLKGRDRTPPSAPALFPVISPTRLTFQTIEGRAEPGTILTISGGVETVTTDAALGSGLFSANVKLPVGTNNFTITAADDAGNVSPALQFSIVSDPNMAAPPAGQAAQINISTGNAQKGLPASELPRPLIVVVTDRTGAPVPSVSVQFSVQEGGGNFVGGGNNITASTDAQGRASVRYVSGVEPGPQQVRASFTGNTSTPAVFLAETLETSANGETTVSGAVLDQNLRALPNVLVRIGGQQTRTGADGRFLVANVASGPHQLLELIGRDQITLPGRWPNITYDYDVLPGVANDLGRPLFLPKVNDGISLPLDSGNVVTQDTVYELPVAAGEAPIRVTARAGTHVSFPPDVTDKRLSVTRIATNRVPMVLEDGRATNLYISVQPSGAIFDQPLEISFPNLDHLPANTQVLLMSFDHDAGRYVKYGTGRVSADARTVTSDPGSGIRIGAWHSLPPDPPQPEVTVLGHIQIADNPAFEGKRLYNAEAWVEGTRAVLLNPPAALEDAEALDYRATFSLAPGASAFLTKMEATLQTSDVNLTIYNGGDGGPKVAEKDEEKVGAFTVANLNDTDGNGVVDKDSNKVTATAAGRDEIDLMKLEIAKPVGAATDKVILKLVSGSATFWEKATKETQVTTLEFPISSLPQTLWVEANAASASVRDIEIELSYKGAKDTVKATAVWAERTNFRNSNTDTSLSPDADGSDIKSTFSNQYTKLGLIDSNTNGHRNAMEMEFTVKPAGLEKESKVVFDITRQKETVFVVSRQGSLGLLVVPGIAPVSFPTSIEDTNDDNDTSDEDSKPKNNHIYSIDGPGTSLAAMTDDRLVMRFNFNEFVRVRFDGKSFRNTNGPAEGSQCSPKVPWRSRADYTKGPHAEFIRNNTVTGENEIELQHKQLRSRL